MQPPPPSLADAASVVAFWRDAGPKAWFAKDAAFDVAFRDRFAALYCRAMRAELAHWRGDATGALAEILLLDQYPRNAFRGSPWMYASDALAREAADQMTRTGLDREIDASLRAFCYLPFEHSEQLADLDRCVELMDALGSEFAKFSRHHRDIIARFGRFPHRNAVLGRTSTPEEQSFLDEGGFKG